jgi:DNA topoisomerase-2
MKTRKLVKKTPAKKRASPPDSDLEKPAKKAKGKDAKPIEEIYQKKTQREHILLRPDTYIGSTEADNREIWSFDKSTQSIVWADVKLVPGLYKIFDEILVNAADNKVRDKTMSTIKVSIDRVKNEIAVWNDGKGIEVQIHAKEQVYIPELIFGHLLTSSNYDDSEKKVTGGRNGYGAKLCNIFSKEFIVETSDRVSGSKFYQRFTKNMSTMEPPKISKAVANDFTKITFVPDLEKFGMTEIDDDLYGIFVRRVYDLAGVVKDVKVFLNEERIKCKGFKEYTQMYLKDEKLVYENLGSRWEVGFAVSDNGFRQVSFVNSIATTRGGTHVDHVAKQLVDKVQEQLKKKTKGNNPMKPNQIRNYLWIFINCHIENPTFDTQTKENLTLKVSNWGSKCTLSDDFIKKVLKSGIVELLLEDVNKKSQKQLVKTDGKKTGRITGIAKLDDANNAGTRNAGDCTLILTEGDSAKALAISGLAVIGRDNYGVFPLRGKMLNVRDATAKQVTGNEEITNLKKILGLKQEEKYTTADSRNKLRYGKVMIMADQDHDGSHIKGLIINFIDKFWPDLLNVPNFVYEFITPIVKVSRGQRELAFYTLYEYEQWKSANNAGRGWKIKYYKGLGTSTSADAKKYFAAMDKHAKPFARATEVDHNLITMAFSKDKVADRKEWMTNYDPNTFMDHSMPIISIRDFVNKELIQFSMHDLHRSIPCVVDGFKPVQRKIMFGCFKRKLTSEIKLAQLGGYIAEHTSYHHGEVSLTNTIIGLAQNYVGSNNLNLLEPIGQFGTRLQGGKDSAHARYIFTKLAPIARLVFPQQDDALLEYLNDDGQSIEPKWYIPILPLVLVNGAEGIGTGWSTMIPNYNPRDIVANLQRQMQGQDMHPMHPWYRGFIGTIEQLDDKYKISGILNQLDDVTLEILELPIREWTQHYKEFLEGLLNPEEKAKKNSASEAETDKKKPSIKDYKEYHTDTSVHFVITVHSPSDVPKTIAELEKKFRISTTMSIKNMHLFDAEGRIKKYATTLDIIDDFYSLRLEFYHKRKAWLLQQLEAEHRRLENRVRFITEIIQGKLKISNRKRADIIQELSKSGFSTFGKGVDDGYSTDEDNVSTKGYDYLLSMPLWNLTMEKVQQLQQARDGKRQELDALLEKSAVDLWQEDLSKFLEEWSKFEHDMIVDAKMEPKVKREVGDVKISNVKSVKVKREVESKPSFFDAQEPRRVVQTFDPFAVALKPTKVMHTFILPDSDEEMESAKESDA